MAAKRCALMLLLFGLTSLVAAAATTAAEKGTFAVGEFSTTLADSVRGRSIAVLILYPVASVAQTASATPFPLVVLSPGFLLQGEDYRSYGEDLASHGFVVALPTYPWNLLDLNDVTFASDLHFVLNQCLAFNAMVGNALHGLIDPNAIGLSGHSLGAKLSLLEAASDTRVRAAGLLDPVDGSGPVPPDPARYPSVTPELMPQIHIPLLLIGSELGSLVTSLIACAPKDENYEQFFEAAKPPCDRGDANRRRAHAIRRRGREPASCSELCARVGSRRMDPHFVLFVPHCLLLMATQGRGDGDLLPENWSRH